MQSHYLPVNVLFACNVRFSTWSVFVVVVLGLEQALCLIGVGIELDPLLVCRLGDALCLNTSRYEPVTDGIDGFLSRSEELDDFLSRVVLAVLGRVMLRTDVAPELVRVASCRKCHALTPP